jgi:hypothetical protein
VANGPSTVGGNDPIHGPDLPALFAQAPVLRVSNSRVGPPGPAGVGPKFPAFVPTLGDELCERRLSDRRRVDKKRGEVDIMARSLVVVRGTAIVRADRNRTPWKTHHAPFTEGVIPRRNRGNHGFRGMVWLTALQLQSLENRLVVLVFVLKHHPRRRNRRRVAAPRP